MKKLLKSMVLAIVPMMVLACTVRADDDLMSQLASGEEIAFADADINVESFDLDGLDVDQLAGEAGEDEAVEACFRRFGYHSYSHNYCRPYSYHCYPTYSYCRPLYYQHTYYTTYYTPVYHSYWGCY